MFNQSSQASIFGALSSFLNSILGILLSLFNAVLAVFMAILALGVEFVRSALILVRGSVKMVAELGQSLLAFVTSANFVAILIVGGLYYAYTRSGEHRSRRRKLKA